MKASNLFAFGFVVCFLLWITDDYFEGEWDEPLAGNWKWEIDAWYLLLLFLGIIVWTALYRWLDNRYEVRRR